MAKKLSFDDKINGLAAYYEKLSAVNPDNMKASEQPPFYSSDFDVVKGLQDAQRSLVFQLGCHALVEYGKRGFGKKDLREADATEVQERAGILTMMTVPANPEKFFERAKKIERFLGSVVAGGEISVAEHKWDMWRIYGSTTQIDTSREIYALFPNGHASTRILAVQYDTSDTVHNHDRAVTVALPRMFDEGVVTYPDAEAA